MGKPYLSIIIPCLNEEHFLPFLLKDLNSQIFKDFEVIVIDGKSEDKTTQIVKKFKSKYPLYLYTTKTKNVSHQRNLGAKKAKGIILIFFDADVQIQKNYLQKIAYTFKTKNPDFLTTYLKVNSAKPIEKLYAKYCNLTLEVGKTGPGYSFGAMQAIKRKFFIEIKGYDTKATFGEDTLLFKKLIKHKYKYILLKNPKHILSMRRFQNKDSLKQFILYLKLGITNVFLNGHYNKLGKQYQMGGKYYSSK